MMYWKSSGYILLRPPLRSSDDLLAAEVKHAVHSPNKQTNNSKSVIMGVILLDRSNDALNINPPVGTFHLVVHGSDWLWAVFAVYCLTLIITIITSYFARSGEKIFHYLFTIALLTGSVAYFAAASDLGNIAVLTADNTRGTRQIFYSRYINWYVLRASLDSKDKS